jgi:hypothetical protein
MAVKSWKLAILEFESRCLRSMLMFLNGSLSARSLPLNPSELGIFVGTEEAICFYADGIAIREIELDFPIVKMQWHAPSERLYVLKFDGSGNALIGFYDRELATYKLLREIGVEVITFAVTFIGELLICFSNGSVARVDIGEDLLEILPPGSAVSICSTFDAATWLLGTDACMGGLNVRCMTKGDVFDLPPPASAVRIASLPDRTALGLNTQGKVWRFHPEGAGSFLECRNDPDCRLCLKSPPLSGIIDIAVGPSGAIWFLAGDPRQRRVYFARDISEGEGKSYQIPFVNCIAPV